MGVVVRVILRNRTKRMCVCVCVCVFTPPPPPYKHTCQLLEPKFLFKSKSRKTLMSQLKVVREGISLTHGRVSPFVLCRLSTDWMKPTPLERAICFTWLMGLNGNHHSGLDENPFHGGMWLRREKPGDKSPGHHQSFIHSCWWLKVNVSSDSAHCVH